MSRGAAGNVWEALKTNGNFCDTTRHGIRENASQFTLYFFVLPRLFLAGAGGIEPPNGGIKIRCLTAWLRPNSDLETALAGPYAVSSGNAGL